MKRMHTLLGCLTITLSPHVFAANLLEIYQLAHSNDPTYLGAINLQKAANESVPQARAALLPNLSAEASKNRTKPNIYKGVAVNTSSYEVTLTQPIFQYDLWANLRQANATVKQAAAQYAASEQDLMLRAATAYFNTLAARDNLQFAKTAEKQFAKQLEQAKLRYQVGLVAMTEVKEAEAKYDASRAAAIKAENDLSNAYEALNAITGATETPLLTQLAPKIPLIKPEPDNIDRWVDIAKKQDYTLQAARYQVDIQRAIIANKQAGHLPSLNMSGSFSGNEFANSGNSSSSSSSSGSGSSSNQGSTQFEKGWTVGVTLNVPIFAGGGISSSVRQAEYNYEKSLDDLEKATRDTITQTRSAYRGIITNISQVEALKQSVIASQAALEATQAGFEVGTKTNVDVLDRIADLQQQQQNYAQARYDYIIQLLTLKKSAGTLDVTDLMQVNGWLASS